MKTKIIYGILVRGKIMYVGQTNDMARRHKQHLQRVNSPACIANQDAFYEKLRAIPVDGWSMLPLEACAPEDANDREAHWIKKFETADSGWNVNSSGGAGREPGCSNPRGADHYLYGKKMPAHVTEASAAARRGKKHSLETRARMCAGQRRRKLAGGKSGGMAPRAVVRSDGIEFGSISEAARAMNIAPTGILNAIKRGRMSRGYLWNYAHPEEPIK